MPTQVGSLYTSLTLESASFLSNMKRAATAAEQGAAQIDRAFGAIKGAAVGFVAAITVDAVGGLVSRGLEYASSLGEVSQQLGVTTKDLQVYRFAATQVGISQQDIDKGLQRLTRAIGENNKGFQELGIKTTDASGRLRSTGDVFRDLADKIGSIKDPAARARYEVELFGKTGQTLDTILTEGGKGIDAYAAAAAQLGIVLDDTAIKKADDAADKMSALNQVLSANIARTVADNATSILALANAIESTAAAAGRGIVKVADYFRGLAAIYKQTDGQGVTGFLTRFQAVVDPVGVTSVGASQRGFEEIMAGNGNLSANGLPGFVGDRVAVPGIGAGGGAAAAAKKTKAGKAAVDIYKGLSASDVRLGGLDTLSDVLGRDGGVSQGLQQALDTSKAFALSLDDIKGVAVDLSKVEIIDPELAAAGDKFASDLSRGLGQAIIYGQSLGDALTNSIKAAAAELVTSGLLDLLKGGGSSGGGLFGSILSGVKSIFGGGKAGGGGVRGGYSYDVGELGRERVVIPANGQIIPNNMLTGGGNQSVRVSVDVQPSPLFITSVAAVSSSAGRNAAGEAVRSATRGHMPMSRGA